MDHGISLDAINAKTNKPSNNEGQRGIKSSAKYLVQREDLNGCEEAKDDSSDSEMSKSAEEDPHAEFRLSSFV